jgi:hypothetical protein
MKYILTSALLRCDLYTRRKKNRWSRFIGVDYSADVLSHGRQLAAERGAAVAEAVSFEQGDVYKLRWPDATFTAVHAHQLLLHLADPVAALRELKRVLKGPGSGAVLALRDADIGATAIYPPCTEVSKGIGLTGQRIAATGAEPDAGRRLRHWALQAGFPESALHFSVGAICCATQRECAEWADSTAALLAGEDSSWAQSAIQGGHATAEQLRRLADAWRRWGQQPGATFFMPCGQLLIRL